MAQGTCSIEGCERPHWAKGYCHPHYSADRRKRLGRESLHLRTCVVCGTDWQTTRKDAKLCSDQCRSVCYSQPRVKCPLPSNHPVMLEIQRLRAEAKRQREAASRSDYAWRTARECRGCGCMFTPLYTSTMLDCSRRCQGRVHRRRRRAAEHGAVGTFIWSDCASLNALGLRVRTAGSEPANWTRTTSSPCRAGDTTLLPTCCRRAAHAMRTSETCCWMSGQRIANGAGFHRAQLRGPARTSGTGT